MKSRLIIGAVFSGEDRSISASWLRGKSLDFSKETESAQDIIMGLEKVDGMYMR
jgi:hypothetical protein